MMILEFQLIHQPTQKKQFVREQKFDFAYTVADKMMLMWWSRNLVTTVPLKRTVTVWSPRLGLYFTFDAATRVIMDINNLYVEESTVCHWSFVFKQIQHVYILLWEVINNVFLCTILSPLYTKAFSKSWENCPCPLTHCGQSHYNTSC